MLSTLTTFLASVAPSRVPDSGMTVALISGGVLALGLFARFMKSHKK